MRRRGRYCVLLMTSAAVRRRVHGIVRWRLRPTLLPRAQRTRCTGAQHAAVIVDEDVWRGVRWVNMELGLRVTVPAVAPVRDHGLL